MFPLSTDVCLLHILGRQMVLETLHALTSNTKIIKEAMAKGQCEYIFYYSERWCMFLLGCSCETI